MLNIYDVKESLIAENTAVVGYRLDFEIVDQSEKAPIKCVCTSTWIKENNRWACVMHTETELEIK
ncbi:hypothetical protein D3C80_1940310 [compost metagenome]